VVIICSQCGTQADDDMRFCPICGAPLNLSGNMRSSRNENRTTRANRIEQRRQRQETIEAQNRDQSSNLVQDEITAPNLYELLTQAKQKKMAHTTSASSTSVNQDVLNTNQEAAQVMVKPIPTRRQKIKEKIPVIKRKSDLTPEKKEKLKEALHSLNKLDKMLEASAIIDRDGTILVSAVSNRYSEQMMAMVTMNIFDIASDSIKALSGGNLKLLNLIADNAIVMLTWVNSQTVLILITSPKSQIGLLTMYSQLISQKINEILSS